MQAQDRAYRFGQKNPVQVFRLISQGTVEELVYMRQLYKKTLQDVILDVATGVSTRIGDDDDEDDESLNTFRQFEGIQGDSSCRGELFGMENILQYHEGR